MAHCKLLSEKRRKLMLSVEYAWMWLNKQDSEYALGPKYAKILNMAEYSICEHYTEF